MANRRGGARVGAGRKPGSTNMARWLDSITEKERLDIKAWILKNYQNNSALAVWVADHTFGKAPQPIEGAGSGGEIILKWVK